MRPPVTDKRDMYRRLAAGEFGNTTPQFFSVRTWGDDPSSAKIAMWGVRTMTPGGPCRLNCPTAEVGFTATQYELAGHRINISCMIDRLVTVTAWLEVWDSPTGLVVEGIEYPKIPEWTWRSAMPDPARRRQWSGSVSRMVLRRHLNANSLDDVYILLAEYPNHVIEFSAVEECFGTVPHRNHICWEVRRY